MDAKAGAQERFDRARDDLIALSHRMSRPSGTGFEEEQAAGWLSETLADAGFSVETGICDLPTAFHRPGRKRTAAYRTLCRI